MSNLYGLYIGTVIANDDPARAGRVKVRIEGITTPTAATSVSYKFPIGDNIAGGLTPDEIDTSRISTVWANVAGPIKGECSLGKYNRTRNIASTADFSTPNGMGDVGNSALDVEGRQTPPSSQFSRISDAFAYAPGITVQKTNTYAYSYMSQGYPNAVKGTYSILSIGAKVYIQFINGSYRDPVVIGVLNTKTGFSQLYNTEVNAPSYPSAFENTAAGNI